MIRFRIWTLWAARSEDSGMIVEAADADEAICIAACRGVVAGQGSRPTFRGIHAQPVTS